MKPRPVVAGRIYLLTRRCTQRQYLLRPDKHIVQTYEYCLAEAAARFGITLFGWTVMSNHQHVVARDNRGNFPEFLGHLNKMLAKTINPYRRRRENLWATEQPNAVWLVDASDAFDKLIYVLVNPVADHLVERATDWPGASSLELNLSGREKTIKRPRGFFRSAGPMPETVILRAERLEGFEHLSPAEWRDEVLGRVRAAEQDARTRRIEENRRVLGRKAVLRANPTNTPDTVEPPNRLRPTVACRNPERRRHALDMLREFRVAHEEALRRWLTGNREVVFPEGTYRMRLLGARCAVAPVDKCAALVS